MGFVHQRDFKKRIWCPAGWYALPQILHRISAGYIHIIRSRWGYPRRHFINCIPVICRRPCSFADSANGLQKQLTDLYKYASLWHIIINIPKTIVLIFNKRYTSECDNFYHWDNVIEKAGKYKYLGVIYSTKYTKNVLKETFLPLASQAGKAVFFSTQALSARSR